MEKIIYTYALVKSLYDKGEDYIDSFWPFTIKAFSSEDITLELKAIQNKLDENDGLKIPLHPLKTILSRAKKREYLDHKIIKDKIKF